MNGLAGTAQQGEDDACQQAPDPELDDDMPGSAILRALGWLAQAREIIAAGEAARPARAAGRQRAVADREAAT